MQGRNVRIPGIAASTRPEAAVAVLFTTSERNASIPAALENAIEWASRGPWCGDSLAWLER